MRAIGLLLTTTMLVAGCSDLHQPPTSADTQFSVVVYNQTKVPVFALFHEVGACGSATMSAQDIMPVGVTPTAAPGVVSLPGSLKITTPRGYTGTVSVVVTDGGASSVTLGDLSSSALPVCAGGV
jgi:hypothetical protein